MPVLQFKGKTAVENYHYVVPHHTLAFDESLSVLGVEEKPNLDGNLIIEGDNLLALKALLPTHAGRIKCIYIDPPYNTGNEGWVYNDKLNQPQFKEWLGQTVGKEGEDATRHDKWCCMMYPRLQLLRELLRDDGAIFVSIDDNEVHHLRMMMEEMFGEENFVATIIWRNSTGPKQSNQLSTSHDYILCFAKNKLQWNRNLLPRTPEQEADYTNPDNDLRGAWRSGGLDARNYYSKGLYSITCPGGRVIEGPPGGSYWRVSEETLWELDADARIWWGEDKNNVPRIKRFLSEVQDGLIPQTVWDHLDVGHTQEAKQEYLQILADVGVMTTPKPLALLKRVFQIATNPGDLILDSFAGSGSSGHAILEMNKEDGGNRKFILVQMPYDTNDNEKQQFNICKKVTAERVRRAIAGYSFTKRGAKGKTKREKVEGLGSSFSYVQLGEPLFNEYRDLGRRLPSYQEVAKYIFYTETSHEFDPQAVNHETGKIGEYHGVSYYLLYTPNNEDEQSFSVKWLESLGEQERNRHLVVYCEKIWAHRDDLLHYEREHRREVRPMLVPFNLR